MYFSKHRWCGDAEELDGHTICFANGSSICSIHWKNYRLTDVNVADYQPRLSMGRTWASGPSMCLLFSVCILIKACTLHLEQQALIKPKEEIVKTCGIHDVFTF